MNPCFNMKRILSIGTLFVVTIVALVWYHFPIKSTATVELYCDDPSIGSLYAEFDLRISRSLFAPPVIDGTIRIEDANYVVWTRQKYGLVNNMLRKLKGEMNIPTFVNSANFGKGVDKLIGDLLHIHNIQFGKNYTIEDVSVSMTSNDYGVWSSFTLAS